MWTKQHAIISAVLAPFIAATTFNGTGISIPTGLLLIPYGIAVGTLIDLDHFVISRYRTGNWMDLKKVLNRPRHYIQNQDEIFGSHAVKVTDRLGTHLLALGLVNFAAIFTVGTIHAFLNFTSHMIFLHILCDIYADLKTRYISYQDEIHDFIGFVRQEVRK